MIADEPTWSRARWMRVIAVLFAGQLFLAWALAERAVKPVREAKFGAPVALLTLPSANLAIQNHPEVAGATLFALVDPRGFSGKAWLRSESRETPLTDWKEPEFFLAANPDRLGLPFQRFIQTNAPKLTSAAIIPVFQQTPINLPPVLPPDQSSFVVLGELAQRKLLEAPGIPLVPLAGALRSTQVTIAVDASGEVFSAVVERTSDDATADQQALEAARQLALEYARKLRFAPSPTRKPGSAIGADLTWGTVSFRWQTTAPSLIKPDLK
ncbi:MAG TPA: hypothetical protein VGH19_24090 [Verrucomicrobiae bacterium]